MISKMDKRRKWKNVDNEEGKNQRKVEEELKRATDKSIIEFQGTGCYDFIYMQTEELRWN